MVPSPAHRTILKRLLKRLAQPIVLALAILYFLIDAIVLTMLRPLVRHLERVPLMERLGVWIRGLGPYPTLALFVVPIAILEPAKPLGLYLIATQRAALGIAAILLAEFLKIAMVERLFHMSKAKLMQIPLFARLYTFVTGWLGVLDAFPPWRFVKTAAGNLRRTIRQAARSIWRRATRQSGAWTRRL